MHHRGARTPRGWGFSLGLAVVIRSMTGFLCTVRDFNLVSLNCLSSFTPHLFPQPQRHELMTTDSLVFA